MWSGLFIQQKVDRKPVERAKHHNCKLPSQCYTTFYIPIFKKPSFLSERRGCGPACGRPPEKTDAVLLCTAARWPWVAFSVLSQVPAARPQPFTNTEDFLTRSKTQVPVVRDAAL